MAATNFSAFTVVGFSGAGYRMGFAFYAVMAYGAGLMALTFILIGIPAFRIGRELGLVTPSELIEARFGSRRLGVLFAGVQSSFTLPYLALQPLAAGYVLESLLGVPHALGAAVVTAVIVCYVLAGSMRSVAWTDVVQGFVMLAALAAGLGVVVAALGGWGAAMARLAAASPEHLTRPGAGAGLSVGIWASYMALWFMADPMLPQLFQRFYAARSEKAIVTTAALYPVVTTVLFFLPVAIGAFGRLVIPGLEGQKADTIFPLLMERVGGGWLAGLAAAGVLAAIMSTMDSQLLTLASIVERDFLRRREAGAQRIAGPPSTRATTRRSRFAAHARFLMGWGRALAWALVLGAFCVLSTDWWRFDGRSPAMAAGLPDWVVHFVVLGFLLALALALFGRDATHVGAARCRAGCARPPAG